LGYILPVYNPVPAGYLWLVVSVGSVAVGFVFGFD
jgi:hypothetical protein